MTTSEFVFSQGTLDLSRPGTGDPTLRAWDATDELLLEKALEVAADVEEPRILVVDDQFGALTLGLSMFSPTVIGDSAVLRTALDINASLNPSLPASGTVYSWLNPPRDLFDLVVLRIPRQADYLAWLLRWINGVMADSGVLLAGGMIKHLPAKSVEVFGGAVQTEQVLPSRKKARVVRCRKGAASLEGWSGAWKGYAMTGRDGRVNVEALPAVFAREKLDIGSRLMLPHVAKMVSIADAGSSVLDLACGNGVQGLEALAQRGDLQLCFSDVSSQAVLSARHNVEKAYPHAHAAFTHCDGLPSEAGLFDLILLNPPFHEGGVVGDHIAMRLFEQASDHLKPGGSLLMVGNRHLGYHRSLRRYFSSVQQLDANPKFVVFLAGNR
ncbi:class I SAM-dependent methyltransferase [Marinobacter sp. F3R08]|uniref:class I SAM-dependent methyltransferase n=1 Tax=Marinobacter sp. F3R08 TaxID=2841559 RepID=UPI001C08DF07|nr:methyltransferase [Marinobacter sp. F3R08]MBU2955298.1 methyltransferase [Marinobacter sp. F3R08]